MDALGPFDVASESAAAHERTNERTTGGHDDADGSDARVRHGTTVGAAVGTVGAVVSQPPADGGTAPESGRTQGACGFLEVHVSG